MRKLLAGVVWVPVMATLVFCSSCGSDDGIATIEFLNTTGTVTESFGYTLFYNRSLPQGTEVQVAFDGTLQPEEYTYELIPAGVYITVTDDEVYDPGDTLIVTLTGITGPAKLGGKQTMTLRVKDFDEDARPGLRMELTWDAGNGTAGDVDMDLFLWRENPPGSSNFELVGSAVQIGNVFELLTVRNDSGIFPDGVYGIGCNYYSGSASPLSFTLKYRAQKGTINNDSIVARFNGTYTLANLNRWDQSGTYHVLQTFEKTGNNFHSFSAFNIPGTGSRTRNGTFYAAGLKKGQ